MGAERGPCLRCFLAAVSRHDDLLALFLAAGIEPVHRVRSPAHPCRCRPGCEGDSPPSSPRKLAGGPRRTPGTPPIPLDGAEPTAHVVPAQAACGCSPRLARAGGGRLRAGPPRPLAFFLLRGGPGAAPAMLDPVTGLVSTPRAAPADVSSAVFVALADYADPTRGLHSHLAWARSGPIRVVRSGGRSRTGFGAGWDIGEARAKAVLEAYERLLTPAWPDEPPFPPRRPRTSMPRRTGSGPWPASAKKGAAGAGAAAWKTE